MKIFNKTVQMAESLFHQSYNNRDGYQQFHFACIFKKKKLLSIGQNVMDKPMAKALRFAMMFNLEQKKKWPYLHAEIDAISKLWGKHYLDGGYTLISVRLSYINGVLELRNAKPCCDCTEVINAIGLKCYYSDNLGNVEEL